MSSHGNPEVSDGFLDSDCACTCCFYQYVFNYCFRNYCEDKNEYSRARGYISNVCSAAPIRTNIKPYSDDVDEYHIELFISNDGSVYRTLEDEDKSVLYDHISEVMDIPSLRKAYPNYMTKRSLAAEWKSTEDNDYSPHDDNEDYDLEPQFPEPDSTFESKDINEDSQHAKSENFTRDIGAPQVDTEPFSNIYSDTSDLTTEPAGNASNVEENDNIDASTDTFEDEEAADDEVDSYEDLDIPSYPPGAQAVGDVLVPGHSHDYNDMRDWSSAPLNPDDYEDIENFDDIEGVDPIDPAHRNTPKVARRFLEKRGMNYDLFNQIFTQGPDSAFGDVSELSMGQLMDVFDSLQGDSEAFLIGLKMYFEPSVYKTFFDAFQIGLESQTVPDKKFEVNTTIIEGLSECHDVTYNTFYTPFARGGIFRNREIELSGCALGFITRSVKGFGKQVIRGGQISCRDGCDFLGFLESTCGNLFLGIPDENEALVLWDRAKNYYCNPPSDTLSNPLPSNLDILSSAPSSVLLDYEDKIASDIGLLENIAPVATPLGVQSELAEFEAEYIWKSSSSNPLDQAISASIVLDKCEMEKSDLDDYMQFTLDSCDIRDLYYCKNHYKHTKCLPDATVPTNACNNACCLEIKMAQCAKSHCGSKKAVNEFQLVANLVCTKYADASYMNGTLPFPDAMPYTSTVSSTTDCGGETEEPLSTEKSTPTETFTSDEETETDPNAALDPTVGPYDDPGPHIYERSETPTFDMWDDDFSAQYGGDNYDDVKARVGKSVCKLDEFKPGFDTSSCGKQEVKDCIKEGIKMLKDDPAHFCPYCVNDNAYDECRCACCFGRYFSRVCYDPNCKDLSEKLRYKRYVKEVCKTKPTTKYLFLRDAEEPFVEEKPRFQTGASKSTVKAASENVLDVFAGFDDLYPSVDTSGLEQPVNPNTNLLDTMRKSSLRRPLRSGKNSLGKRGITNSGEVSKINDDGDVIGSIAESVYKKLGTGAKKFSKGFPFDLHLKPRKKEAFSILDRKPKASSPLLDVNPDIDDSATARGTQSPLSARRKAKHRRLSTIEMKKRKKSGRRASLSGEKFGTSKRRQPKIRILNSDLTQKANFPLSPKPVAKREYLSFPLHGQQTVLSSAYPREILYKREHIDYVKGPEIPENAIRVQGKWVTTCTDEILLSSVDSSSSSGATFLTSSSEYNSESKHYKTITRTITKLSSGNITAPSTTKTTFTFTTSITATVPTKTSSSSSVLPSPSASVPHFTSATTILSTLTTTVVSSLPVVPPDKITVTSTITTSHTSTTTTTIVTETTVISSSTELSCAFNETLTSIRTRFRPSTTTATEYQSVTTLLTTDYEDVITETIAKKTVYRYKDTSYETETVPITVIKTSTRERLIPNITITEIEESDKTVNNTLTESTTTTETEYETAYRETYVTTLTTYSGTDTTTAFKFTKTKWKKTGTTTETITETETDDVIKTRWYPVSTSTEYDETLTTVKYKWYPYTTTDLETTTFTTVSTQTTTETETSIITKTAPARPVPSLPSISDILNSLLSRRDLRDEDFDAYGASKLQTRGVEDESSEVQYVIVEEVVVVVLPDDVASPVAAQTAVQYNAAPLTFMESIASQSSILTETKIKTTSRLPVSLNTPGSSNFNKSHPNGLLSNATSLDSSAHKSILDGRLVYVSSFVILLASFIFVLIPDAGNDTPLLEDQGASTGRVATYLGNDDHDDGYQFEDAGHPLELM